MAGAGPAEGEPCVNLTACITEAELMVQQILDG